ncbi:MAG: flavin reductase, partial [Clostridia bacterium]|nr:flavin reductase [Clostridia bacterium]
TKVESKEVSAPTIKECPIALECRVCEIVPLGTHDMFVADILSVSVDESLLDEKGKLCLDRAKLCAFAHGDYYELGKKLGKFGFSTDKKKPSKIKKEK